MRNPSILLSILLTLPGLLAGREILPGLGDARVGKSGDTVEVSFEIAGPIMRPNDKITYVPVLYGSDSCLELQPLTLSRRQRAISDSRTGETAGMRKIIDRRPNSSIRYRVTVPYRDWMQQVSLKVNEVLSTCGLSVALSQTSLAGNLRLYYAITPHYDRQERAYALAKPERFVSGNPMVHPAAKYAERLILAEEQHDLSNAVRFKLSSSQLDESLPVNVELLDEAVRAVRLVREAPDVTLKKIFIAGYTSPEGTQALNIALARKRALAIKNYLIRNAGIPADADYFELYDGGEDWNGLRELVARADMPEKQEVLRIIDSSMTNQQRKTALKSLGAPYSYMLRKFYPILRNAGYVQIYYDAAPTAPSVVTDSVSGLSIGSGHTKNTSVAIYNQALALMNEGRWAEARDELLASDSDSTSLNSLGVCYMMLGDYDAADACFTPAAANGEPNAPLNLKETETARKVR